MKLTITEVEARLSAAWGTEALVVPHRIAGNRRVYVATDHGEHWLPIQSSWLGGQQVFEPAEGSWPEPEPGPWAEAVAEAMQRTRAHLVSEKNGPALRRLPRAKTIAETRNWIRLGDELDTWVIPSQTRKGVLYQVNGRCTCMDFEEYGDGWWCKHRLARALAKRAERVLNNENGAGGGGITPAPVAPKGQYEEPESTTASTKGQASRIEVIVAYEADEARSLPRINGNGELVSFQADGQEAEPPTQSVPDLYRWLQDEGYVPRDFQWLGWGRGLRQRRQTYVLQASP